MVNALRNHPSENAKKLAKKDYDCIYKIRTFRNAHVHSSPSDIILTPQDVMDGMQIIKTLEK